MPKRPARPDPLAQKKRLLERLGIPPEKAGDLTFEQLRKMKIAEKVAILKTFGIEPRMVFLPAFANKTLKQLQMDALRLTPRGYVRGQAPKARPAVAAKYQVSAEERGSRVQRIVDGEDQRVVLAEKKIGDKPINFREHDMIANSARRRLFEMAKGDVEEAVRLMMARGFSEGLSRDFAIEQKKRLPVKEKEEV